MGLAKRHLARHYRLSALDLLGRLGYATTRQLTRGVWGLITPSRRRMANRTIARLLKDGHLVAKRDGIAGERLVALTRAGAELLEYALPKDRHHARDWLRHAHNHRTAANSVFVAASCLQAEGVVDGLTELEIRAGDAPADLGRYAFQMDGQLHHKIPDCLLKTAAGYVWVEVENAWRGDRDFRKCLAWLRAMFWSHSPVAEVWFVITAPGAATIGKRLVKALGLKSFAEDARPRQLRELDARILQKHIKVFALDAELLNLTPVNL